MHRESIQKNKPVTRAASELSIGDTVTVGGYTFTITQIDTTKNGYCLVDKYACDCYVTKNQIIELKGDEEIRQDI